MRLDKYLADLGLGTRSELKKEIRKGSAMINGQLIRDPSASVRESDEVLYHNVPAVYEQFVYYLLHKPAGIITASRDSREKTVLDLLTGQVPRSLFPVGRLDRDTEGLLLITNNGKISHCLLSPKSHVDKTYLAIVTGESLKEEEITAFQQGIPLADGTRCLPAEIQTPSDELINSYLNSEPSSDSAGPSSVPVQITIREGKFHQIKRMVHACGREVLYLKRIAMGPLMLDPNLPKGAYRRLTEREIFELDNFTT